MSTGRDTTGEIDVETTVKYLLQDFSTEVLPQLQILRNSTERYLLFLAWLNTRLEELGLGRLIVVGGFAVEVYTVAAYRTLDVDIVVEGSRAVEVVEKFLEVLCRERRGRVWVPQYEVLAEKAIDVVSTFYSRPRSPIKLRVGQYHLYLESPEELVITYLSAWKYWDSTLDRDKVYYLVGTWWERLDREYVFRRAEQERVLEYLRQVLRDLGIEHE